MDIIIVLKISNLNYQIQNKKILNNINLEFAKGEFYALVGHNGSGKSTLIKLLAAQIKNQSGEISLNGKKIEDYAKKEFAKSVAYLPQILPDASHLTGLELVMAGRYAHGGRYFTDKENDAKIATECLQITDTLKFKDQIVSTLSGGEKSRIFLAMLLAQESDFLLLDEPLAPLDIAHQLSVMALIKKMAKELGKCVIIVIHDINLACSHCDKIIALKGGELILNCPSSEAMSAEKIKEIYGVNAHIIAHPKTNLLTAMF
ncbi:ABC transporter ATP-binding protein [Campylobacter sp. JMF_14 EL1]|nr:ABC transporter ATP-binding protein [Campylobacter sp. JMF_14 EL1]